MECSHGESQCNWEHVEVVVFVFLRSFSSPKSDKLMLILARQRCVRTICGCLCKGVRVCLILCAINFREQLFLFFSFFPL